MNIQEQKGVISLMMAFSTVALIGMTALALDLGHGWIVKQELRNVADGAALTGARRLGQIYEGIGPSQQKNYFLTTADKQVIIDKINSLTPNSLAGGKSIGFAASDIAIGTWDSGTKTLTPVPLDTPGSPRPTAVRVLVRRDGSLNQPLGTFFAGVMGIQGIDIATSATAAMTTLAVAAPGAIGAPIAISKEWFTGGVCGGNVKFHPTGTIEGCAGWHTFLDPDTSANSLGNVIDGLRDGSFTAPEAVVGQTIFHFNGGTVASVFNNFKTLYNQNKDNNGEWKVLVPVYDRDDCGNPTGPITIIGFTTATIYQVTQAPDKAIDAVINCETYELGRGDGTSGGVPTTPIGTIPGLVS